MQRPGCNAPLEQARKASRSGSISASGQPEMPSLMVLDICGIIEVTGTASRSDRAPLYARDRTDIDISHAHLAGNAQYGVLFRSVNNLHSDEITLQMNVDISGLGKGTLGQVARLGAFVRGGTLCL